ncbi:hypothetical protein EBR21_07045 [bacterium]|nr:hypothetical protein [bacterium]
MCKSGRNLSSDRSRQQRKCTCGTHRIVAQG